MNVRGSKNMVLILDRGFLSAIGVSFKKIPDGIFITMKKLTVSLMSGRTV